MAIAFVALLEASSWMVLGPSSGCLINPENYASYYAQHDQCPALHVVFIESTAGVLEALGHEWITALATLAIAGFTLAIVHVNRSQLRHANQVERAYISAGGWGEFNSIRGTDGTIIEFATGRFRVQVNNHGKTPGEVFRFAIEFRNTDAVLPEEPVYEAFVPHHNWIGPGTQSRTIDAVAPPADIRNPMIVYGRIFYRDIFTPRVHWSGFFQDFNRETGQSRSVVPPSRAYIGWDESDESH